jgi:hypothetical protein
MDIEERGLLNESQFRFRACQSMTFKCVRLTDHVPFTFNNNISMAAVFLDKVNVFDTYWHSGFSYKLSDLEFSSSITKAY